MNRGDKLIPGAIKAQCMSAINTLQKQSDDLWACDKALDQFIYDDAIQSVAFSGMKQQIKDYKTVTSQIRRANAMDISDYSSLMKSVGNEELYGDMILDGMEEALRDKAMHLQQAEAYREMARNSIFPNLISEFLSMASAYEELAGLAQRRYEIWKEKQERFDSINSATAGLFSNSGGIRSTINEALAGIGSAFHMGGFQPDRNAPWRKECVSEAYEEFNEALDKKTEYEKNIKELEERLRKDAYTVEKIELSKKIAYQKQELEKINNLLAEKVIRYAEEKVDLTPLQIPDDILKRIDGMFTKETKREVVETILSYSLRKESGESLEKRLESALDKKSTALGEEYDLYFVYEYLSSLDSSKSEYFSYHKIPQSELYMIAYHLMMEDNLTGNEMPKWWIEENTAILKEYERKLEKGEEVSKEEICSFGLNTFIAVDMISGRINIDEEGNSVSAKEIRTYADPTNDECGVYLSTLWYDYVYGVYEDIKYNTPTQRRLRYLYEHDYGFGDERDTCGIYHIYTNSPTPLAEFSRDAYLTKYGHSEDYYKQVLGAKLDSTKQILAYMKKDKKAGIIDMNLTEEERNLIEQVRSTSHLIDQVPYRTFDDIAANLERDLGLNGVGARISVEGTKITIILDQFADGQFSPWETNETSFTMDFSDYESVFGGKYIKSDVFAEQIYRYAQEKIEKGWLTYEDEQALHTQVDRYIQESGIDLEATYGTEQAEAAYKQMMSSIETDNLMLEVYRTDRSRTNLEQFNKRRAILVNVTLAATTIALLANPTSIPLVVASIGIQAADASIDLSQGETEEAIQKYLFAGVEGAGYVKYLKASGKGIQGVDSVADDVFREFDYSGDYKIFVNKGGLNSVDDIIKDVENGDILLENTIQKGNYGEMKMDAYFESQGYKRVSLDKVTDLNATTHQGIDGVYYNPDGIPPYIIGEAKYGSSKLSTLADGTKQMSAQWIEGGKTTPRLEISVGKDLADDILMEGYSSKLVNIDSKGNIISCDLDATGKKIK